MEPKSTTGKAADQVTPPAATNHAELLLGQMMFAMGQGADGVHIERLAVAKMRQRYERPTYAFVREPDWDAIWRTRGIYTLRYFEAIGRAAAQYAKGEGSPWIDRDQFERARILVEAHYRRHQHGAESEGTIDFVIRGDICPPEDESPFPPPEPK